MSKLPGSFGWTFPTASTPGCTWATSYAGPNTQYAVGGAIGLAFSAKAEANATWQAAKDFGLATGNHSVLPNGTHVVGPTINNHSAGSQMTIIKSDTCIRYEPESGYCSGITSDGKRYTYMK